jgi:hypothetical protein
MAAYHFAAIRASPLLPLLFKESIDTFVSDVFQVLDHAQVVFGSVTFVEGLKSAAGEILAFIAEPYQPFPNQVAMPFHESTVLATWQATGAVSPLEPFLVQVIL